VRVIGGEPPPSGPPQLTYQPGDLVRLEVVSDGSIGVELQGYGITRTIPAGKPTLMSFRATRSGNFPLIAAGSRIGLAELHVGTPSGP
jgi:hypothetical protein